MLLHVSACSLLLPRMLLSLLRVGVKTLRYAIFQTMRVEYISLQHNAHVRGSLQKICGGTSQIAERFPSHPKSFMAYVISINPQFSFLIPLGSTGFHLISWFDAKLPFTHFHSPSACSSLRPTQTSSLPPNFFPRILQNVSSLLFCNYMSIY